MVASPGQNLVEFRMKQLVFEHGWNGWNLAGIDEGTEGRKRLAGRGLGVRQWQDFR